MKDQGTPIVGEGAAIGFGLTSADREPGTVVKIDVFKSGPNAGKPKRVTVRMDKVERDPAKKRGWIFTRDPDGVTCTFVYQRHRGGYAWKQEGGSEKAPVTFGGRSYAHDQHY